MEVASPAPKRPRLEYVVDERRLCSPVTFTSVLPRPRMSLLPLKRKTTPAGATASAGSGASSDGPAGEAATASLPLVRPPLLQNLDDYLSLVGNMYYQAPESGQSTSSFSVIRRTTLGMLTSPIREPSVLDRWAPYEIALFESAIALVGKGFPQISAVIGTKNVREVIEFYYIWKKSKNYAHWKATYRHVLPEAE